MLRIRKFLVRDHDNHTVYAWWVQRKVVTLFGLLIWWQNIVRLRNRSTAESWIQDEIAITGEDYERNQNINNRASQ